MSTMLDMLNVYENGMGNAIYLHNPTQLRPIVCLIINHLLPSMPLMNILYLHASSLRITTYTSVVCLLQNFSQSAVRPE